MNLQSEVRTKIAVKAPLKMRRENSGDDQTLMVCDGAEGFYSGDRHSYYRGEAKVNPDCNFSLSRFYELEKIPPRPKPLAVIVFDWRAGTGIVCWSVPLGGTPRRIQSALCVSILLEH